MFLVCFCISNDLCSFLHINAPFTCEMSNNPFSWFAGFAVESILETMLGCLNPKFLSNMDKPKIWVKNELKNVQLKVKVEVGLKF